MTCYDPRPAWQINSPAHENPVIKIGALPGNAYARGYDVEAFKVPCRQCIGCRLDKTRDWTVRLTDELRYWETASFLTLTYADEHMPMHGSISKRALQLFIKRLRKSLDGEVRHFSIGEYGDKFGRPHYHSILFGYDFPDRQFHKWNNGKVVYISDDLKALWPAGFSTIQGVSEDSIAYVAGYCQKKIVGKKADEHYYRQHPTEDRQVTVRPEFQLQSLGLGKQYYEDYKDDLYPEDFHLLKGKPVPIPEYYDRLHAREYPEEHAALVERRKTKAAENEQDQTPERLAVREKIAIKKRNAKTRQMETDDETNMFFNLRREG